MNSPQSSITSAEVASEVLDGSHLRRPGFGLPLDWSPTDIRANNATCFNHGANDFSVERMTVYEVSMLRFMDSVTDKVEWNRKIFNDAIVAEWRRETCANPGNMISAKAFDWCVAELRDRAYAFERDGYTRTLEGGARVIKSDSIISNDLCNELCDAVRPLLELDGQSRDWHPNSDQQVLDHVHPSLYPLVYGRTRILPIGQVGLSNCTDYCGQGETSQADQDVPELHEAEYRCWGAPLRYWSNRFQWLPAEVRFKGQHGTDVAFTSYINNLCPKAHQSIYAVVEKIVAKAIPAWNETLISNHQPRNALRIRERNPELDPERTPKWLFQRALHVETEPRHQEFLAMLRDYLRLPEPPDSLGNMDEEQPPSDVFTRPISDWDNNWTPTRAIDWKYRRLRRIVPPEPGTHYSYGDWVQGQLGVARDSYRIKLEEEFREDGLQIIVKLASIELTPEKPSYAGGNWHIEGMLNEHIVATAIYYFDTINCSESRLRFRQESKLDELALKYEQHDHGPLIKFYGTRSMRRERAVQEVGSIDTREGRLLVFPNTLQHKVEPFHLVDEGKSGHRRILVLWLVDPHYRISSTANVAPQQEDQYMKHLRVDDWNRSLPIEISDEIVSYAKENIMTLEEAKELRLNLMDERTQFTEDVDQGLHLYHLCEH